MRENVCGESHRRWRHRLGRGLGVIALGVALPLAIVMPAAAQDEVSSSDAGAVVVTEEGLVVDATTNPASIYPVPDPQAAFTAAFLACVEATGDAGVCTEEVLENIGLEEEGAEDVVDVTPLNPVDVAGSEVVVVPLDVNPPGT